MPPLQDPTPWALTMPRRTWIAVNRLNDSMIPLLLVLSLPFSMTARVDAAEFPEDDLETRIEQVNEGELRFLEPPQGTVHRHINRIRISPSSLADGWVELEQCHEGLDAVPELQILYHPQRIRGIRILDSEGIGAVRVEGPSVQLQGVGKSAKLCLRADSRALRRLPEGGWMLRNGPYMRRFLDGYYTMGVSLEIRYPAELMRLEGREPRNQPGFRLRERPGVIEVDAWFEGRLFTRFTFSPQGSD